MARADRSKHEDHDGTKVTMKELRVIPFHPHKGALRLGLQKPRDVAAQRGQIDRSPAIAEGPVVLEKREIIGQDGPRSDEAPHLLRPGGRTSPTCFRHV
jgi:hypothetical protein